MPGAKVIVEMAGRAPYSVRIGASLLDSLGRHLRAEGDTAQTALIICDDGVAALYLGRLKTVLSQAGYRTLDITVPAGSQAATIACAEELWRAFASIDLGREATVFALGGRSVCSIAAFVAATYRDGIPCVLVPTTLAAMMTSTVTAATRIGLAPGQKALEVEAVPAYACASLDLTSSLSAVQWESGCAEALRAALGAGDEFLFWLSDAAPALAERDATATAAALARCTALRADLIGALQEAGNEPFARREAKDPAAFCYGDPFVEAARAQGGTTLSAGRLLADGMRFSLRLGAALVGTPLDLVREQDAILDALGLPPTVLRVEVDAAVNAMALCGNAEDGCISFALPRDVGDFVQVPVPLDVVREHLRARNEAIAPA